MTQIELDAATKQRLADEVERLVAMGKTRKEARQIVWLDYQDELAAFTAPAPPEPVQPEPAPPDTPVPEPPEPPPQPAVTTPARKFWQAADEPSFTPDWLSRNRAELAKVKRLLRSKI